MKYWVYKDSRILGPFEKDAVAGVPGVDSSTLVCAGESAAVGEADWRPAGDVADFAALPRERGAAWPAADEFPSTGSLLDGLQLDAAGLISDDDFPGAARDLFQDADMKRAFGDLIAPRVGPDPSEAELRRSKDRVVELTAHLEVLYKRVSELEAGHTDLLHRLAEKEMLLRLQPAPLTPPPAAPRAAAPAAAPAPAPEPVVEAVAPPVPVLRPAASPVKAAAPAPIPPAPLPPAPVPPLPAAAAAPVPEMPVLAPKAAAPAPKKPLFEKKVFKVLPSVKSFKIVDSETAASAAAPAARPAPVPEPELAPIPVPVRAAAPAPAPMPEIAIEPEIPPVLEAQAPAPVSTPAPAPAPTPAPAMSGWDVAPPAPAAEPARVPSSWDAPPMTASYSRDAAAQSAPPATGVFSGTEEPVSAQSTQEVLARLAKPAPAPATEAPRPPRSNKLLLFGGAGLVVVMAVVGFLFLRHPKDLKQMADLDDGRARVGAEPVEDPSRPPLVKPVPVQPVAGASPAPTSPAAALPAGAPLGGAAPAPQASLQASQAALQGKLDAAIAAVKDFPLDGQRGTVGQWLQFSYSAAPDAGQEAWSASETADKTYLVEYRFTPASRGEDVHYLFEVDMERGFVIGKSLDARNVLSGGAPAAEKAKPKAKPKAKKKAARPAKARRAAARPAAETTKDVSLLPLPNEGELRPPSEDDGAFNADTVNSGL